jgi:NAD(P)-dependent dehydrogenase (short-subunit alcohol dehydrogenase family)
LYLKSSRRGIPDDACKCLPKEVTGAVAFLVSSDATYITAKEINVDGVGQI